MAQALSVVHAAAVELPRDWATQTNGANHMRLLLGRKALLSRQWRQRNYNGIACTLAGLPNVLLASVSL